jgi:hypothetical protein
LPFIVALGEHAAGHPDLIGRAAIGVVGRAEEAVARVGALAHDEHAGAVAEEHGGAAVLGRELVLLRCDLSIALSEQHVPRVRHEARVRLRTDDEHGLGRTGADEAIGQLHAERHRRALLPDVERGHARDAELGAEERARAGEDMLGGHRREDDVVDLGGVDVRRREGLARRGHREIRDALPLRDVVTLLDAGARPDPLVAGVHHARELIVSDWRARDEAPRADDGRARHGRTHSTRAHGHTTRTLALGCRVASSDAPALEVERARRTGFFTQASGNAEEMSASRRTFQAARGTLGPFGGPRACVPTTSALAGRRREPST